MSKTVKIASYSKPLKNNKPLVTTKTSLYNYQNLDKYLKWNLYFNDNGKR